MSAAPPRLPGPPWLRGGGGPIAAAARLALAPLGCAYGGVARTRLAAYRAGLLSSHSLDRPTISVGNLTTGGTGKTPFTAWLLEVARASGVEPAVLARGYGGDRSGNDEVAMLIDRFPGLAIGVGADRVEAAQRVRAQHPEVDLWILDDGFQHRRVLRDLDCVLVDATDPLGGGACLPRGLLREPPRGLARADLVVATRSDLVDEPSREALWRQLAAFGYRGARIEAAHGPTSLESLGAPHRSLALDELRGRPVRLLSSIAHPAAFASTVARLGAAIREERAFPDHHRYLPADLPDLRDGTDGTIWLTTEKDAPKLRRLGVIDGWVLRVELRWLRGEPELRARLAPWLSKRGAAMSQ